MTVHEVVEDETPTVLLAFTENSLCAAYHWLPRSSSEAPRVYDTFLYNGELDMLQVGLARTLTAFKYTGQLYLKTASSGPHP